MDTRNISISQAIGYGWASVKKDLWYFVGLTLVYLIISGITNSSDKNPNSWDVLGCFLSAWMTCGFTTMMLNYHAGKKLPFQNLFTQLKYYWQVLGATILLGIIICLGFILLIVPGVYLALRFQFTITLILDKGLGIFEAMKESTRMTNGIKMSLLGFDLTLLGVVILGAICLGVGVLVAIPVASLAMVFVYRQVAGQLPTNSVS